MLGISPFVQEDDIIEQKKSFTTYTPSIWSHNKFEAYLSIQRWDFCDDNFSIIPYSEKWQSAKKEEDDIPRTKNDLEYMPHLYQVNTQNFKLSNHTLVAGIFVTVIFSLTPYSEKW